MYDHIPITPLDRSLFVVEAMKQAYLDGLLSVNLGDYPLWRILERAGQATSVDNPDLQKILDLHQDTRFRYI